MRHPRLSLTGKFAVLSFVVIAATGVLVGAVLHERIQHRALLQAERLAVGVARVGLQGQLRPGDLKSPGGLPPAKLSRLDRLLVSGGTLTRVKIYDTRGRVVYSDERSFIGQDGSRSVKVHGALNGRTKADVERGDSDDGQGSQRLLEVYAPLRLGAGAAPDGVLELYLPYAPVAHDIAQDTRTLALLLSAGLLVLYAGLFWIVRGASRRMRREALSDGLTGLANRAHLHERGPERLAAAERDKRTAALLLLDLDRFKEVNDTLGHERGDELLQAVSERLRDALREEDLLARLGGDEFAVLLASPHRAAIPDVATRLRSALERPFALRDVAVTIDASIGIAYSPEHGSDVSTLLRHADVAMYDAKGGRAGIRAYVPEADPYSPERLALLAELRRAIDADELVLHFQPKVSLKSRDVVGVEALVRWQHPERGLLGPGEFLPMAEQTGLIADVTRWVLEAAVAEAASWRAAGRDLPVAVNLAAANVVDANLPDLVAATLARHALPASRLECEISENTVMADPRRTHDVLARLRALGVRLSLDDFGTGRSSLSYLKRLPLDEVKIDRSFVAGMAEDDGDAAIVRATIDLARHLGLEVVAEGVETEQVLVGLARLHCDIAQGFLIGRPQPAAALADWLKQRDGGLGTGAVPVQRPSDDAPRRQVRATG